MTRTGLHTERRTGAGAAKDLAGLAVILDVELLIIPIEAAISLRSLSDGH